MSDITKILETKDARIERLLGLLGQAEEILEWVCNHRVDGAVKSQAAIVVAKIRVEREA